MVDPKAVDLTEQYKLAYEIGLRSLSQQQESLASARARAGTLIAAVSISTSFLGGAAVETADLGPWGAVSLVLFGLSVLSSVIVLLPRGTSERSRSVKGAGWFFGLSPTALVTKIDEQEAAPLAAWYKGLAQEIGRFLPLNEKRIDLHLRCLQVATVCLLAETMTWILELT